MHLQVAQPTPFRMFYKHSGAVSLIAFLLCSIMLPWSSATAAPAASTKDRSASGSRKKETASVTAQVSCSRSFLMEMTPCEFAHTPESVAEIYKIVNASSDLIAHHLDDGIPWEEALAGKPYHANVEKKIQARLQNSASTKRIYLAVTPIKGELNDAWGENVKMKREGAWKDKHIDDPEAIKAYLNFCNDLIKRFKPDYFAYGIEVNTDATKNKSWPEFVTMAKEVYSSLKKEHPKLPVFLTFQLDEYWKDPEEQEKVIRQVLPYTDYIAVSTYPYFSGYFDPGRIPNAWFSRFANFAPNKPFVIAETGFTAEDFDAVGIKGSGSPQWQKDYVEFLLRESARLKSRFVVWYVPKDYDKFFDDVQVLSLLGVPIDLFKIWKDSGLLDGQGKPRPAYSTWMNKLRCPLEN